MSECKGCIFFRDTVCFLLINNNKDCPCSTCLIKSMCTTICQNIREHIVQEMDDMMEGL